MALGLPEWVMIGSVVVNMGIALLGLKLSNEINKSEAKMREELRLVELYMRDNFVRRATFDKVVDMMTTQMQAHFDRLFAEISRLHDRLDRSNGPQG